MNAVERMELVKESVDRVVGRPWPIRRQVVKRNWFDEGSFLFCLMFAFFYFRHLQK